LSTNSLLICPINYFTGDERTRVRVVKMVGVAEHY